MANAATENRAAPAAGGRDVGGVERKRQAVATQLRRLAAQVESGEVEMDLAVASERVRVVQPEKTGTQVVHLLSTGVTGLVALAVNRGLALPPNTRARLDAACQGLVPKAVDLPAIHVRGIGELETGELETLAAGYYADGKGALMAAVESEIQWGVPTPDGFKHPDEL